MALINLERLLPREKVLLGVGCLAVLLAIGNWAVARRLHARLAELSTKIRDDSARLEQNFAIIAKKDHVQAKYDSIKLHIPNTPSKGAADVLSTEVEQMAAGCGVSLLDRKPQESAKMGFFEKACVRFELVGDQVGLGKLICRTETSPQLLRISRMEISKNPRAGSFPLKAVLYVTAIAQVPDKS